MTAKHDHDSLQPHAHDPNPEPPGDDPTITLKNLSGDVHRITPRDLDLLPQTTVTGCYIVSTGHGTSGPFSFGGVRLLDLLLEYDRGAWDEVEVISGDGFGSRVFRQELERPDPAGPILLATRIDARPLTREEGLVRLVVPAERDDALRQVKWIARVNVLKRPSPRSARGEDPNE